VGGVHKNQTDHTIHMENFWQPSSQLNHFRGLRYHSFRNTFPLLQIAALAHKCGAVFLPFLHVKRSGRYRSRSVFIVTRHSTTCRCRIPNCVGKVFDRGLCKRHCLLVKRGRIDRQANGGRLCAVNVAYPFCMPATGGESCVTSVKPPEPPFNGENLAARNRRDDSLDEK